MPLESAPRQEQNTARSFSCFLCEATEPSAAEMERHIKHFHSDGSESLKNCDYTCVFCAFRTSLEEELEFHVNAEHSEQHTCPLCGSSFRRLEDVENHIAKSHTEDAQTSQKTGQTFTKLKNGIAENGMVIDRNSPDKSGSQCEDNKSGDLELPAVRNAKEIMVMKRNSQGKSSQTEHNKSGDLESPAVKNSEDMVTDRNSQDSQSECNTLGNLESPAVKNSEDIMVTHRNSQDSQSEHNKSGDLESPSVKKEKFCSSGSMDLSVEVLETSLRLNDCPAEYSNTTDHSHQHDDEMNDFDSVSEDMDSDEKPTGVCGDVSDGESNLLAILGSTHQNGNVTKKRRTLDCRGMGMEVSEGSHGGARPKSITRNPASSSRDDPTETQPPSSPEDAENLHACDTDGLRSTGLMSSSVDVDGNSSYSCPLCSFQTSSECGIQYHVIQEHEVEGEDHSAGLDAGSLVLYSCPFCADGFDLPNDLSQHINTIHPDGEAGAGSSSHDWSAVTGSWVPLPSSSKGSGQRSTCLECPVCGFVLKDGNEALLSAHVSDHFASSPTAQGQADRDRQLAARLQSQENKQQQEEDQKFQKLQTQHGMDNSMTAKQQFERDLEHAVSRGKMTTREFHQKKVIQAQSSHSGVDDGSTQVPGVLERLRRFYDSKSCPRTVIQAYLCNSTHHYSGSYGDKGWGCGYRNFQMMLSSLMNEPRYLQVLFNGKAKMPSIQKLQQLTEKAWQKGFDPQGCAQLGGNIVNTRKWIGATEIVATLSSFRIKCQLLDFGEPSGPDNTHPTMIRWVRDYFKSSNHFKPPLYLQHQGHSRTIVGIEDLRNGNTNLLLFDPGVPKARMEQFHGKISYNLLQTVRKTVNAFRAKQYQIVAVVGILDDREFERSKTLRSTKMS